MINQMSPMLNSSSNKTTTTVKPSSSDNRLINHKPRKRECNVLKFHNFVPNEELSTISRVRGSNENESGHCLKEENGSKQINVSNWQRKQQQSTLKVDNKINLHHQSMKMLSKEISLISNDNFTTTTSSSSKINDDELTSQSILGTLLARNEINRMDISDQSHSDGLINSYTVINVDGVGGGDGQSDSINQINDDYGFIVPTAKSSTRTLTSSTIKCPIKTNRRKPSTVRRFLRSSESPSNGDYEDNCDNDERTNDPNEPLDLTTKKRPLLKGKKSTVSNNNLSQLMDYLPVILPGSGGSDQRLPQTMITPFLPYLLPNHHHNSHHHHPINQQQQSNLTPSTRNGISATKVNDPTVFSKQNKLFALRLNAHQQRSQSHRNPSSTSLSTSSSSSSASSLSPSSSSNSVTPVHHYLHHSSRGSSSTIPGVGHFKFNMNGNKSSISGNHHHPHNHPNGPVVERNTIKAKLENEFRTNGFLVKTKEVSDGEATFCKFRQLRKYTRYYLKSWHQHLPDEINKLWKGFLPPKTSKPSPSSPSSSSFSTTSASSPITVATPSTFTLTPAISNTQTLVQSGSPLREKLITSKPQSKPELIQQPMETTLTAYPSFS